MRQIDTNQLLNKALTLHHQGKLDDADIIYLEIIKYDKDNFQANHLHGCILSQKTQFSDAIIFLEKAINIDPDNYEANNNLGIAYKNTGNVIESERYFNKAISIDSKNYKAFFNCANLYVDNLEYEKALDYLEQAMLINISSSEAPCRMGQVYQYIFQRDRSLIYLEKSKKYFLQAIERNINNIEAYLMLGMTTLWLGDIDEADNLFKKVLKLNHSQKNYIDENIKKYYSDTKSLSILITHEFEQLRHIDNDTDDIRNPKFTKQYYDLLDSLYKKVKSSNLKSEDITDTIKKDLFKILYNKPPKNITHNLLNEKNDIPELELEYLNGKPEIIVIDDFLSKPALTELQKFCRNSNIFKYPYHSGYVSAFLSKGLSNKFILKLSEDLRMTYKKIFKELRLSQAWIFKYESNKQGTNIHADQASVNVNFWVTPEEGNLDKNKGGLRVWDDLPSKNSDFSSYNNIDNSPKIRKMLDDNKIKSITIPYRENRAVIFNSQLYHETDDFDFDESYSNKRINITFLYD